MERYDPEVLANYNRALEVINAIQKESKECDIIVNLDNVVRSELMDYVSALIVENNIPADYCSVYYTGAYIGDFIEIREIESAWGLSIPMITVAKAHLNAKLIAAAENIADYPSELLTDPEMHQHLCVMADLLGVTQAQREYTPDEVEIQEQGLRNWADDDDLRGHIVRACGAYLPSNAFRRTGMLARAFAAQAILKQRESKEGNK